VRGQQLVCFSDPIATLCSREGRLFEVYQTQGRARLYIPEVPAWELHASLLRMTHERLREKEGERA
jgi:hypothetical protein